MPNGSRTLMDAVNDLCEGHKINPDCFTKRDLNDLESLIRGTNWLLGEAHRGQMNGIQHHQAFDRVHTLLGRLEKKQSDYQYRTKYNPYHKPAGSPNSTGGEFDNAPGGGVDKLPSPRPRAYPPVPRRADGKFPISETDWQIYHDNLHKGPEISNTEHNAYAKIFAMEGGYKPDGKTFAGITPQALDVAKESLDLQGKLENIKTPKDLIKNLELIPHVYKNVLDSALDKVGGSAALDKVGNKYAAAAMADAVFREGATGGGKIIANAIIDTNPHLATDTGVVRQKTFDSYSKLAKSTATLKPLLDNLAKERIKYSLNKRNKSEAHRADYFRFEKELKR